MAREGAGDCRDHLVLLERLELGEVGVLGQQVRSRDRLQLAAREARQHGCPGSERGRPVDQVGEEAVGEGVPLGAGDFLGGG